jgi:hypothetical protein
MGNGPFKERKENIRGIPNDERDRQWRERDALGQVEVTEQADNRSSDASDDKSRWCRG